MRKGVKKMLVGIKEGSQGNLWFPANLEEE